MILTLFLILDYTPITSSHPRARSRALKCGDGRKVASEMRRQGLRDRSGDTRPVGAVAVEADYAIRAAAAQVVWSRLASRRSRDMAAGASAAS
jgi:hypothetical protein